MEGLTIFSNPWIITVICVAFGFPLVVGGLRFLRKKFFPQKAKKVNRDAQHVRDVVKKYDQRNAEKAEKAAKAEKHEEKKEDEQ